MAKTAIIIISVIYSIYMLATAYTISFDDMKKKFIDGQCITGRILVNAFYAPVWFLKAIRFIITTIIK